MMGEKICPECKMKIQESLKACPNCGYPFEEKGTPIEEIAETKICPECKATVAADLETCSKCGFPFENTKSDIQVQNPNTVVCPECKAKIDANLKICSNCGFPFENTKTEINTQIAKEKVCPECKTKIHAEATVCPNCGFPFAKGKTNSKANSNSKPLNNVSEKMTAINHNKSVPSFILKVAAVLMFIIALDNLPYIFRFLGAWIDNLLDFEIFSLYTITYFIYAVESALTTLGFTITGITLLINNKKDYLKIGTILIVSSYALRVLEDLFLCIDWFEGSSLLALILSLITFAVWSITAFVPEPANEKDAKVRRTVLLTVTPLLLLVEMLFVANVTVGTFLMLIIEYSLLALYIFCGFEGVCNVNKEHTYVRSEEGIRMNAETTESSLQGTQNKESIYGYLKIWKLIVFSILTMGIYTYIWIYRTVGLFNAKRIGEERSQGVQVVLCLFVPFYTIYWLYKQSKLTEEYTVKVGSRSTDLAVLSIILSVFGLGIVAMVLIQDAINKNLEIENGYVTVNSYANIQKEYPPKGEVKQPSMTDSKPQSVNKADRIADDDIEYLKKLKELCDMEILSEEEYKKEKEKVLRKQG